VILGASGITGEPPALDFINAFEEYAVKAA
jgi:hypothetical protein